MTRFALTLEYDGAPYMGLQRQAHGPSVQQHVEDAIGKMTGETVTLFAAGRTDAGVHALAMRAHVDVAADVSAYRLMQGINGIIRPEPIAVTACAAVGDDWHARFSCIGRRYLYRVANRRSRLALEAGRVWQIPYALDVAAMHEAAQVLVGYHDFTTFRSVKCQAKSPLKTLERLDATAAETLYGPEIHIRAAAPSFLHHQVRSMVGCLALVGQGKWNTADLQDALAARDRLALGFNAPPDGLYFVEAVYP